MGVLRSLEVAGRVSRTILSYLTVRAVANPSSSRKFLRTVANTIVDFPEIEAQALRQLPAIGIEHICPEASTLELSLTATPAREHALPSDEYFCLAALARSSEPSLAFEIGTNRGRSTRLIAEMAPEHAKVYTLDLPPERMLDGKCFKEARGEFIGEEFRNHPARSKITQLYGDSKTFDFSPFHGRCDFIFIDGDHSYEGVKADTDHALKMLKPGGIIVWDDYHPVYGPGVMRCLEELARTTPVHQIKGTRFGYYQAAG